MTSAGAPPRGLPELGAELRAARERLGWELRDLAAYLRIRAAYLQALEAGRASELPPAAYTVGFLRSYAAALGLDPNEQVKRFNACGSGKNRPVPLAFPVPVPERGLPAGAVALLGIVLAVTVYGGWFRLSGEGRLPAEVVPPVPERLAPLAEQAIPLTPRAPLPARVASEAVVAASPAAPPVELPAVLPSSAAAAMPVPPPSLTGSGIASTPPVASPGAEEGRIVLRARADSWLQVRERNGAVLLNRVLRAGEAWPVPARPGLLFSTGNAGGTELVMDGVAAPALGGAGAVRRDLPLEAEAIRSGRLSPKVQAASTGAAALAGYAAAPPRPTGQ